MIGLLWSCLILFPLLLGSGILALFYGKNTTYDITFSESFVLGAIACIGISEVVHLVGYFLYLSLQKCAGFWGLSLGSLAVAAVLVFCLRLKGQFRTRLAFCKDFKPEKTVIPFVFLGIVLFQLLFIFCTKTIHTEGDIYLETVQSFLAEDGIYRVLPLTGRASESGVPLRYGILCLPTVYAMLCSIFGTDAELLMCHVVPVIVVAIAYLGYFYLSGVLFDKQDFRKRFLFLLAIGLIILFTDTGVSGNGYNALHSGYLGTSVRNLILVPYVFAATLERRYFKAVLGVLAEACVAWTLWGMGICFVILAGMIILNILECKCTKLKSFMQIFRDKEDLT